MLRVLRLNAFSLTDPHCLSVPVSLFPSSVSPGSSDGLFSSSREHALGSNLVPDSETSVSRPNLFSPSESVSPSASVSPNSSVSPDNLFPALIDSGSSDCFIDTNFINKNTLQPYPVSPLQLRLFDSSMNNMITQAINLSVRFPSG